MSKKNLFIAFEGIDGSGKSTQVKLLSEKLKSSGHKVYATFEPTDSPIGSLIRNIFNHRIEADHKTIAALFVADRLDHLLNKTNGIVQKLEQGYTVITDRYYFSSYAYHGTHMDMDWVISSNQMAAEILKPDVNIYIDMLPEESMERIKSTRSNIEMYETLENLKAVRSKYLEAFEKLCRQENIITINGNHSLETVSQNVWDAIADLLN
ncbi:MAG: dTMP kinase [Saprospiraceae bacterium]|nr:dTMP kinase [Saprospiraceae bacterium]